MKIPVTYMLLVVLVLFSMPLLLFSVPSSDTIITHASLLVKGVLGAIVVVAVLVALLASILSLRRMKQGSYGYKGRPSQRCTRRGRQTDFCISTSKGRPSKGSSQEPVLLESPIEALFLRTWKRRYGSIPLIPQYQIGRYRVDFAHLPTRTIIELDGFEAHSSTTQIAKDRKRQRELEAQGWRFIRFGGKEVYYNPVECVQETYAFILRLQRTS